MVADPSRFKPTNGQSSRMARQRAKNHLTPLPRKGERGNSPRVAAAEFPAGGADRTPLLEYAAFVLEQEAKYCQQ